MLPRYSTSEHCAFADQPGHRAIGMRECESGDCINWTFSATQGFAHYPHGQLATLTYKIVGNTIKIDRQMFDGENAGPLYQYSGTSDGNSLHGTYTSTDPRHPSGNWIGDPTSPQPDVPKNFNFCALNCFVMELDNGEPYDKPHYGSRSSGSIWIVERFEPNGILLDRTDYDPSRQTIQGHGILTGRYSPNSHHIVDGVLDWKFSAFGPLAAYTYTMSWGPELDTVPASNAEKTARNYPSHRQLSGPRPVPPQLQFSDAQINLFTALVNLATETIKHSN